MLMRDERRGGSWYGVFGAVVIDDYMVATFGAMRIRFIVQPYAHNNGGIK